MKTKQLVLCFGILSSFAAVSQPVINLGDVTPAFGSSFTTTNATYMDPGEGGANQVWDFSELEGLESYTMNIESPEGTPGSSEFPDATHVSVGDDESVFGYVSYANNKSEVLGFIAPSEGVTMIYNDTRLEMQFPLSMNANFDDTWESEMDMGNDIVNVEIGSSTTTVDGYGTLITPAGTFTDVLRLKYESESTSTTYMEDIEVFSIETTQISYVFVKAGVPTTLASFSAFTIDNETMFDADYLSDQVLGTTDGNKAFVDMSVFPNPANNYVETTFKLETSTVVNVALFSPDGRMVHQWTPQNLAAGQNQLRFDLPNVANGVYLLQTSGSSGTHTEKIAVQR